MSDPSGREMGRRVLDAVRGYVARALTPIVARVKALEDGLIQKGVTVSPGARGEKGDPGERGADGKDGRDGVNGKDGAPGAPGKDGERGPAGARGEKGDPAKDGVNGKDGRDGRDGKDGQNGRDGAPGKDALSIDILPAIDERRSYPRGTYARHANGLWRAAGDTQGMRGWECLVEGVHEITIEQKDERRFLLSISLSDGDKVEKDFVLPVVLDRGVYRPEAEYLKGDGVTWAGSWWIAQVDKPTDKPGVSEQWRLAVKRGRDGKDAQ